MRNFLALFLSIFMGTSALANAEPDMEQINEFHSLVQTGGYSAVREALKENPALAIATDDYGFQAVHLLDYTDFREILTLLIDYGADIDAKNKEGHALLHLLPDAEFLSTVLMAGANLELRDEQGRTPLMLALWEPDNHDMVSGLLEAGADPNTRDDTGQTALGYARAYVDETIVALLTEAGASE